MPITPLDIRKKTFSNQLRGLSAREVKSFLELVAKEMEDLRKERGMLAEKVDELSAQLETYERTEKLLKETLVTAQQTSGEMKAAAEEQSKALRAQAEQDAREVKTSADQEANDRIRKAEQEAEAMLRKARKELDNLTADIRELETRQASMLDQVRSVGHSCMQLADNWQSEDRHPEPKPKPEPEPEGEPDPEPEETPEPEEDEQDTPSEPESEYVDEA